MEQVAATGSVNIRIKGFFPAPYYARDPESPVVDWIEYYPTNQAGQTLVRRPVKEILDVLPMNDPQNPLLVIAHQRKAVVEPAYNAWKANMAVPLDGMPLQAWPVLGPERASIIMHAGIRTVEELANALDSTIAMIKLPNPKDLRTMAQRYLASKDTVLAAKQREELEAVNADLKAQVAEQAETLRKMQDQLARLLTGERADRDEPPRLERRSRLRHTPIPGEADEAMPSDAA